MRTTCLNSKIATERGFKRIELKETSAPKNYRLTFPISSEMSRSPTPEVTRNLFSTGFVYKNNISPKIANVRIDQSLRIKPTDGGDDETEWSVLTFMSEENRRSGIGARADVVRFSEPPIMKILRELRKAPHANRLGIRIIENTPIEIEQWWDLAQDYGTVLEDEVKNRRTLRRIDRERAEVRWSLDEVEEWLMPRERKDKLRRLYEHDPFRDAREHGDYIDASGTCPFDVEELRRWLHAAA